MIWIQFASNQQGATFVYIIIIIVFLANIIDVINACTFVITIVIIIHKFEDETRLMGIDLKCGNNFYHIMDVYMPFDCNDDIDEFSVDLCQR